ncbi:MAG: transglycosylase domain-containing protein [Chloroflexi bacterium]|nr:transglycosylase domain-containing protein [Chloroflexota bacterium]
MNYAHGSGPHGYARAKRLLRSSVRKGTGRRSVVFALIKVFVAVLLVAGSAPLFFSLFAGGSAAAAIAYFSKDLPSPTSITDRDVRQTLKIYDRNGELLAELWDQDFGKRTVTRLSEISPAMIAATLAIEDARFFQNPGFDLEAIARAFLQNREGGEVVSGASTITMQLVRNTLLSEEERQQRSYTRKIREIILAYQLTGQRSKSEILEMYFNEVYYGHLAYGVETAARTYFDKSAKDLTLAEAAMLAGLPQAPSRYDPLANYEAAKARQEQVLDAMVYHEFITSEKAEAVKQQEVKPIERTYGVKAPHFVQYIKDFLESRYGRETMFTGGWQVYTTLDLSMQAKAEKAAREHIAKIKSLNANNASVVSIDPRTGEILVMVGSLDFYDESIDGQVNMAIAERQPGSALKPFNYVTAFAQRGITPSTVIFDQPTGFPDELGRVYMPLNHDKAWHGPVSVRRALASSLNMPAVIMLQHIGIPAFLETLHKAGVTSLNNPRYGLAVTLGAGEVKLLDLTYAYTMFPNNGRQIGAPVPLEFRRPGMREYEPVAITKIVDSNGETVYEYQVPQGKQLVPPQYAFLINTIISDDEARAPTYGPNSFLVLPDRPAAAKTGTTETYQDGWTIGYTPDLVTGVWVGNANNSPMRGVFGVSGAGYIWHNFMEDALKGRPPLQFTEPEGMVRLAVLTTEPGTSHWQIRDDWFLASSPPPTSEDGRPGGTYINVGVRPMAALADELSARTDEKPRLEAFTELRPVGASEVYIVAPKPAQLTGVQPGGATPARGSATDPAPAPAVPAAAVDGADIASPGESPEAQSETEPAPDAATQPSPEEQPVPTQTPPEEQPAAPGPSAPANPDEESTPEGN